MKHLIFAINLTRPSSKRWTCFFAIAIAMALALAAHGSSGSVRRNPLPTQTRWDLQRALNVMSQEAGLPGALLTVDHPGYAPWSGSAGNAAIAPPQAMKPEHRFRAGSTLQTAVAVAVIQLVEQSKLSLSSSLDQVLPSSVVAQIPNASTITLRMLLDHTSGLPDCAENDFDKLMLANPTRSWSLAEYLHRSSSRPRTHQPGKHWSYSNTNYLLLGEVLFFATGMPWRQVVADRVFAPAGMRSSVLPSVGMVACSDCARGYERVGDQTKDTTEMDTSMLGAAGGGAWITTTADQTRFVKALFEGRLFKNRESLEQMLAFLSAPSPVEGRTGYGLGVMRLEVGGVTYWGHLGGTAGFTAYMLYQPETGMAIGGAINIRGDLGALILPVLETLQRLPRKKS